ncbi:MAG: (d)CMP kinase [Deferrisomatales bacterium]|nr:(d)CMP kinase [Deferrisomatales bacterium]
MTDRAVGAVSSRFLLSAPRWQDARELPWPQVAVAGRSNVGKSSLVNFLLGRRGLARTSGAPGRTQTMNFFLVDERFALVDLPGYGYARAPLAAVRAWTASTREYLERGDKLRAVVLLLDVRRDPSVQDLAFVQWVRAAGRTLLPVVTKGDKVSRGRRAGRLREIGRALGIPPGELLLTSSRTGEGRRELWDAIAARVDVEATAGKGHAGTGAPGGSRPLPAGPLVVAIDGPSGAGKSTLARALAERLGWSHIDTGAMYRGIGLKADRLGVSLEDDAGLERLCRETRLELQRGEDGTLRLLLDGEDVSRAIREHRVSGLASRVSARKPVREAMAGYQRRLGEAAPSVLEGRDIGTVVFPDALLKVFLTATDEERARRRTAELLGRGQVAREEEVLEDIRARDRHDSDREHAPLRPAEDAVTVDTTGVGVGELVERLAEMVGGILAARGLCRTTGPGRDR